MAVRGSSQGLLLTPARWATWVAQRHEWNGFLWIRWSDAEAVLLFVSGRPRIHLWDNGGWAEGEHALTAVAQRLDRLPAPRWGQVALPARWAAAIRDLTLLQPALPAEVVPPEAWLAWALQQGFTGLAVLIGETAGAWILQDGLVRAVRFHQGTVIVEDGAAPPQEGVLQIYRGRVSMDISPPLMAPRVPDAAPPAARPVEAPAAMQIPPAWMAPPPVQEEARPEVETPAAEVNAPAPAAAAPVDIAAATPGAAPAAEAPPPPVPEAAPAPIPEAPPAPPVPSPPAPEMPAAPAAKVSPPAPAESGETAVVQARSEVARRFRGDERFLLAPTVDLANPEPLLDLLTEHGEDVLGWLPLLDGTHTLEEVARAGEIPLSVADAVVAWLVDRRLVFRRYTSRPRAATPSP